MYSHRAHADRLPDDRVIAVESPRPQPFADQRHRWRALSILLPSELPPDDRLHSENTQDVRRHASGPQHFRFAPAQNDVLERWSVDANVKRTRVPHRLPPSQRDPSRRRSLSGNLQATSCDGHQFIGIAVGERPHQHAMDDGEDRRVGANANRQRQDRNRSETRLATEHAQRVSEIPDQFFEDRHAPHLPVRLVQVSSIPQLEPRRATSLLVGQTATAVLVNEHREVAVELLREIALSLSVAEDREQPREVPKQRRPAWLTHLATGAASGRSPPTAAPSCWFPPRAAVVPPW